MSRFGVCEVLPHSLLYLFSFPRLILWLSLPLSQRQRKQETADVYSFLLLYVMTGCLDWPAEISVSICLALPPMGLLWLYRSLPGLLNWSHNYSKDTYCHGSSKLKRMFGHWCSDGLIAWGLSHYWFWWVHLPSKFGPWIVVNNVTYTFCLALDLVQVYLRILFYLYFIFADANCNDFFWARKALMKPCWWSAKLRSFELCTITHFLFTLIL